MKKISILIMTLLAAVSCRQAEDTRYFAPEVNFAAGSYAVDAASGALDVELKLSRAAEKPFEVGLYVTSSLQEGKQFTIADKVPVAAGQQSASVHIALVSDEIWDESSWIELQIAPGERYTVNPDADCATRIAVSKEIVLPILRLVAAGDCETNPSMAEPLHFEVQSTVAARSDVDVTLDFDGLRCGDDYLVNGGVTNGFTLAEGARQAGFDITIVKKDISGYDKTCALSLVTRKGEYVVASDASSVDVHLWDPSIDFSAFLKTKALNDGQGYQVRQAIQAPDGSWEGNKTVDLGVSGDGSNYLRNFKNMYMHPSFSCMACSSVSQLFRLPDFCPNLVYPSTVAILDYGNNQDHREFSAVDSLMRFVLDKGETAKGKIYLHAPRKFVARYGNYAAWQEDLPAGKAWVVDSRSTKGDIMASTHEALTGVISVTLEKLEGTFDFSDSGAPVLITAWFSCDDDLFMKDYDTAKYVVTQEDGLWKVNYKFWPR